VNRKPKNRYLRRNSADGKRVGTFGHIIITVRFCFFREAPVASCTWASYEDNTENRGFRLTTNANDNVRTGGECRGKTVILFFFIHLSEIEFIARTVFSCTVSTWAYIPKHDYALLLKFFFKFFLTKHLEKQTISWLSIEMKTYIPLILSWHT